MWDPSSAAPRTGFPVLRSERHTARVRLAIPILLALASACAQPPEAVRRAVITRTTIESPGLIQVVTVELGGEGLDRDRAAQDLADGFDAHAPGDVEWIEAPESVAAHLAVPVLFGGLAEDPELEPEAAGGLRVLDVPTGQVLLGIEWSATSDVGPFVQGRRVLEPAEADWSDAETTGGAPPGELASWDPFFGDDAYFREPAERTLATAAVRELAVTSGGALTMVYVPVDDEVFTVVVVAEP